MEIKELLNGIDEINLWIYEITKVSDDGEENAENKHIKFFYKVLDELRTKIK